MFAGIEVVFWIVGIFAALAFIATMFGSRESDPGERLKESAGAAAGGAFAGLGCILQLIIPAGLLLLGLWLLGKIFS